MIDFMQKLNVVSIVHSGRRFTPMISVFSTASRLLRIAACTAHQPRTLHRPPRVGTQVPAAECRAAAPQQRELRTGEKCAATHCAEAECTQISWPHHDQHLISDEAFSVATNHRQINRYIVDSILQYFRGKSLAANSSSSSSYMLCVQKLFLDANRISVCLNF